MINSFAISLYILRRTVSIISDLGKLIVDAISRTTNYSWNLKFGDIQDFLSTIEIHSYRDIKTLEGESVLISLVHAFVA